MAYRAEVCGPWKDNHPFPMARTWQISADYQIERAEDVTAQPAENITPAPNLVSVMIECEADVLTAIEADDTYSVLWSEEIPDGA